LRAEAIWRGGRAEEIGRGRAEEIVSAPREVSGGDLAEKKGALEGGGGNGE
jgi:hypothetical protein